MTCSPFLVLAVMQHYAKRNKDKWPKATKEVLKNQLTESAGFCLTKWSSNEPTVLRSHPEKDVALECKAKMALGILWNNKEDIITFPVICAPRTD
ncbi:hypothetical protein T4B_10326 [Trichinella pseudospiralis]|nr:hypothetical protein T4A_996 [Trichinella pseudospiralis]KRY86725.1 hypothetical protein T4D_5560 [Trichinella pseudospiralis]KRZ32186.1 hypothetical protein T4B_10326 [Trichinella pseudospiralis]KRZ38987.1 hypothetical protein T4C_2073 [Trichinella pseudospiralis]